MLVNCVNFSNVRFSSIQKNNQKFDIKNQDVRNLDDSKDDSCLLEQISSVLDVALKHAEEDMNNPNKTIFSIDEIKNMYIAKMILKIGKKSIDDILIEKYKNNSQILFAGSKSENKLRMMRNKCIIHGCATTAAAAAAGLAQTPGGDEAVLTALTTGMTAALCLNYNNAPLSSFTPIASQVFGKYAGEAALKYVLKWIPGIGNAANAAITFSLHEATGWALVAALEKHEKDGIINDDIDEYIENADKYRK